ncbi:helix-turn-helix domain-containing protein [Anaerocolumna xylanovorans]|uniref:Desulfoferrodoxin n=1 Tax=Anaerocolumna xylanovorans DSM 12503 TaxID=1121345 RepID=A0A1M7Y0F0_9FIRM|nr:helix-turn-helix domain-containing protein [Anaerocolumna xylanovorans]SHO45083.1 Desulfoferrodoxin [Anaerocolumna xylanovorans DSM 12503]
MDYNKVGTLLCRLRKEKGMTQKQIADKLNISDKAISKWERGLGCPDVSLLGGLSNIFEVNIEKILAGDLKPNNVQMGNLKRIKFYVCPNCGNVINNTGDAEVSCCGRKLSPLAAKPADEMHTVAVEDTEGEYYITFNHEMSKTHYISFVAYVTSDRILLVKLYPEQTASVRLPKISGASLQQKHSSILYYYCNRHGLWVYR